MIKKAKNGNNRINQQFIINHGGNHGRIFKKRKKKKNKKILYWCNDKYINCDYHCTYLFAILS